MAGSANLQHADDRVQYVTLGLGREVFAVEVTRVREILDLCPVALVPNAPSYMMGMIDVRGCGVPVIDLRAKLGLPSAQATQHTRIVVLEAPVNGRILVLGLVADRVYEVTPLTEHAIEPPPDIGVRWRSDYIQGVGRRGDAFVIVFDLARLFSSDEAVLLEGRSAT